MPLQSKAVIEKIGYALDNVESGLNELYSIIPTIQSIVIELKASGDIQSESFELDAGKIIHTRIYKDRYAFVNYTEDAEFKKARASISESGWLITLKEVTEI